MAGKKLRPGKTGHTIKRKTWTVETIVDALFAFHERHGRWPFHWEFGTRNELPSMWKLRRLANPNWYPERPRLERAIWRNPWDFIQREIAKDERCTAQMAFNFRNALARKEAIDRIGFANLIATYPGANKIHAHRNFGELWRLPAERTDEAMHIIKVKNATKEPDGTFAEYFLRVPAYIWNVQEAVAWTFHLDRPRTYGFSRREIRYRPLVET
jgi:hypothetical protein